MRSLWALALAMLLAATPAVSGEADRTVIFAIEKMTCASCPIAVRKAMQRVDGVKSVEVNYDEKLATVVFDASRTTAEAIGQASTDVGFPATARESE